MQLASHFQQIDFGWPQSEYTQEPIIHFQKLLLATPTAAPITSKRAGIEGRADDFLARVYTHHVTD